MLEIGITQNLSVRVESFSPFKTGICTKILYVSDLHLNGRTECLIAQLHRIVHEMQPDVVLLGGDIVDRRGGVPEIAMCVQPMSTICPVWAIPGNHDDYAGRQLVRQQIESAGGQWLEDRSVTLNFATRKIRIDGAVCQQGDPETFSILCAHYPSVFPAAIERSYDLVLAGHLHGSQFVFAKFHECLYPGAFFFRWNGDKFTQRKTAMLVSRGANDTLPIRWNCPHEVILCQIS
jgi:predicted MPP superfamily phosphohydrolase